MNRTEVLRQFRERPVVVWLEFIRVYEPGTEDIYVFFEGRDDQAYFLPEIRRRRRGKGDIVTFRCNGKANVLGMLPNVIRRIDHEWRALFFVDKDLDDLLGLNRIALPCVFETEVYSIENYLVSREAFEVVWTDVFQLSLADARFEAAVAGFDASHGRFLRRARGLMAWVLAARRQMNGRPNLQNAGMSWVFPLAQADGSMRRRRPIARDLESRCQVGGPIPWRCCLAAGRELRGRDPKAFVRGRWELWFFIQFCRRVRAALEQQAGTERPGTGADLNEANAVEILGARLPYPKRVLAFLDRVLPAA